MTNEEPFIPLEDKRRWNEMWAYIQLAFNEILKYRDLREMLFFFPPRESCESCGCEAYQLYQEALGDDS